MPTAVIDREETKDRLPTGRDLGPERKWQALVFLVILIVAGIAGMGALFYRLEHPVPTEMFEWR
jgi:uncharacterized membrane protein